MAEKPDNSALAEMPKRVLMTADTIGGVWTYAMELCAALKEHGITIAVATMGAPVSREQRRQLKQLQNVELHESSYRLEWMEECWPDVARAGEWLIEIEREFHPDVVHLNNFVHGALPFTAPRIVVGHSCVLSWWKAVKGESAPSAWNTYRTKVDEGLRAADYIIAPTRAMLQQLREIYDPLPRAKVISNARNPGLFHPGTKEPMILTAGRLWDEAKNIASLAATAADIPWRIYIAGGEKHPAGCPDKDLSGVCPLGKLPAELLASWYARAAIYTSPALYEPFGLSILEAALSGCALVLSNIPTLRENWNGAAEFVSPHDPSELRNALVRLISNPFRRKELAAYAQCRAIQFNPQHMAREYLAIYAGVLATSQQHESRRSFASPDVLSNAVV